MPTSVHVTAYEIGYTLLEKTKRAYFEDDFALFVSAFMLPHEHVTLQGWAVLETEDDLLVLFRADEGSVQPIGGGRYRQAACVGRIRDTVQDRGNS